MSSPVLLDTSIVVASVVSTSGMIEFIEDLARQERKLHICDQTLFEFWSVATRPPGVNGLGLSVPQVAETVRNLRLAYSHLANPTDLFDRWADLCEEHHVSGKSVHDARLVALMLGHGITEIATLDVSGFSRFPSITPIVPNL